MCDKNTPYDANSLELLAQIINRARTNNSVPTKTSRSKLSADLEVIHQVFSAADETPEKSEITPWDMIQEEHPLPTQRHKIFAKVLVTKDPLAELRKLSRDRSPSEMYLLQVHINTRARSKFANVERSIPKLDSADWNALSKEQKETIFRYIIRLEQYYRGTEYRSQNPTEVLINDAVHELSRIFSVHTHFDGIETDLPYSPTSLFVGFVRAALDPFVIPGKLSKDAISRRWGRIKGLDI